MPFTCPAPPKPDWLNVIFPELIPTRLIGGVTEKSGEPVGLNIPPALP